MVQQFISANSSSRDRLRNLINRISDEELTLDVNAEGWTVAVALAHIAFWDERRLVLVRKWKKEGVSPSQIDVDTINDALVPFLAAIPPRTAARLSLDIAEAIDRELEEAPPDLIKAIEAMGDRHALDRSTHRKLHLDEIEALLKTDFTSH